MYNPVIFLVLISVFTVDAIPPRGPMPCPPITLQYGRARYKHRGRFVKFVCNQGYTLAGDRYSTCVHNQWDIVPPKCVRPTCKAAKPPTNGYIYPSLKGAVLNFYCKPNYELSGPTIAYCDGTNWDTSLPTCRETNTPTKTSCDFETKDLCGWSHDLNHDFDWTRLNRATPSRSVKTGPSHDHTRGEGDDGYYMYIESTQKRENDTARLISPVFPKTTEDTCFEFYYHMYGATIGSLRVYLKKVSAAWDLHPQSALWHKIGNQGDFWWRGLINIGAIDEDFQIIIEGVSGKSYVSDIAIDDVKLIDGCSEEEETTTQWTTSSDEGYYEPFCENNCGANKYYITQLHTYCLCDDYCLEQNNCCPDYFDHCVALDSTSDITPSSTEETETTTEIIYNTPLYTDHFEEEETLAPTTIAKPSPPVTPKKIMTTTIAVTATNLITTKKQVNNSKIIYLKPETDRNDLSNDVVELFPPSTVYAEETPINSVEEYNDIKTRLGVLSEPIKEPNNQSIMNSIHDNNIKTTVFIIGLTVGALIALVLTTFLVKKYSYNNCFGLRNMRRHSTGESQSDVRFLTTDEVLDLNLPGNYDTL